MHSDWRVPVYNALFTQPDGTHSCLLQNVDNGNCCCVKTFLAGEYFHVPPTAGAVSNSRLCSPVGLNKSHGSQLRDNIYFTLNCSQFGTRFETYFLVSPHSYVLNSLPPLSPPSLSVHYTNARVHAPTPGVTLIGLL